LPLDLFSKALITQESLDVIQSLHSVKLCALAARAFRSQ